jgi:hypothetical protein
MRVDIYDLISNTVSLTANFAMNSIYGDNDPVVQVSAVTKHIKVYSDNPIHDAIDRAIDSCAYIDEGDDYMGLASLELKVAAEDLLILACRKLAQLQHKREVDFNAQIADKK